MRIGSFSSIHLRSWSSADTNGSAGREGDSLLHAALVLLAATHLPDDNRAVAEVVDAGHLDLLVAGAVEHRLGPVLMESLRRIGVDVPEPLAEIVSRDRLIRLRSLSALAKVARVLDSADLGWACLKGPAVGSFMQHPELRRFNDLDILVAGADLAEAVDLLRESGIEEMNRNWDGYVRYRVGEIPMAAKGVSIDLHWHLVGLGTHRRGMSLDPVEMLSRTRRRRLGQVDASILSPEDQLIHIAVHSAMSGANRLDQLRDIAVLLESDSIDMALLAETAKLHRVVKLVSHALDRARLAVDAAVDPGWLDDLGGRSLRLRRWIDSRVTRSGFAGSTLAVSAWRDGRLSTAASLAWQLRSRLRSRLGSGVGWDVCDENGPLYFATRSGGEEKRAEYMAGAAVWE